MTATVQDIQGWIKAAPENATHMIVGCDTSHGEDFPVYVLPEGKVKRMIQQLEFGGSGVHEVYNLTKDTEAQLMEDRAWNL